MSLLLGWWVGSIGTPRYHGDSGAPPWFRPGSPDGLLLDCAIGASGGERPAGHAGPGPARNPEEDNTHPRDAGCTVEPAVGLDIRQRRMNMGSLSAPETDTLYDVVRKLEKVWADNDADGVAELFTEDATLVLPGDVYLKGREEIRTYFVRGYAGPMQGTKVTGTPLSARP